MTVIGLETDTYCAARPGGGGGGQTYDRVSIELPGGSSVTLNVPRTIELDLTCGLRLTPFFDPHYPKPEPVYPLDVLRTTLELPHTAKAGSVLRFTVAVHNPTAQGVSLTPCPGYLEAALTSTPDKRTYALNCAPVRAIIPGQTVRFAMRLPLPAGTSHGPTKVLWSLKAPNTESIGTVVVTG
ncbi:hypothetical protein [Jatrophihabitans telluris]|uniref:hypothetical protein n=1 Tax=Jatrophihabitans telluris TaxID=2038343 RepID=UPI003D314BB2